MKNIRFWTMGVLLLSGLCLVAAVVYYYSARSQAFKDRPLILIHNPLNRDEVGVGEGIIVHATARAESGIARVELWVDDILIAERAVDKGEQANSLTLSTTWIPVQTGGHTIVARAITKNGVNGQSAVSISAVDLGEVPTHRVHDGDTLESIAAELGTTPDQLAALNPEVGSSGLAAGSDLIVPGGEPPVEGDALPEEGGEAPSAESDAPATMNLFFGIFERFTADSEPGEPTGLRIEVISLRTPTAYDGLHCYVSLGGSDPGWYPDTDGDPLTDESFSTYAGAGADGASWDAGEYLSGENVPELFWPRNQPIPFDITCVGVAGGGTDALELGRLALEIPPEEWDGIVRRLDVTGEEGSYTVGYRVIHTEDEGRGQPKYIDPDMTSPSNVRLDDRRISLRWDYQPRADEEPIDGFRVYLNGNLQWIEPADSRESGLPYEWFNPPCGSVYTFGVSAYRLGFPDGPESYPGEVALGQREANCTREIQIQFLSLETFNLGGDGNYEDRHGDVGPAYGYFYANERQVTFDGGDLGAGLDMPNGLSHNTLYDLGDMSADVTWRFSGMNSIIVEVPPGGTFEYGFHIMDEDSGRCHDSDDPGCDDLICEGQSMIYTDRFGNFDQIHEEGIRSENDRCRLNVQWGPAFGSPVGSGVAGAEPLPWIQVEDLSIDETSGAVRIQVRNTGTATWPWRDLDVELRTRDGVSLGVFTWTQFVLETGQRTTLEKPEMRVGAPYDVCVVIDPNDEVLEEFERSGALFHSPICPARPDLIITNVAFDGDTGGRMRVTVQNVGDGAVENRTVSLYTTLPDGSPAYIMASWPNINLNLRETRTFDLPVTETTRPRLAGGYTVTVNREPLIAESDPTNNSYTVGGSQRLQIFWCNRNIPHFAGLTSAAHMYFTADVMSGGSSARVVDTSWSHSLSAMDVIYGYGHNEFGFPSGWWSCPFASDPFTILGDQWLRVNIRADYRIGDAGDFEGIGSVELMHAPQDNWDAGILHAGESLCDDTGYYQTVGHAFGLHSLTDYEWFTRYLICRLE